jgi:hypothetical protein
LKLHKDEYCVKIVRGDWSSIVFVGTFDEAKAKARELNQQYQTDEYKVEKYKGFTLLGGK